MIDYEQLECYTSPFEHDPRPPRIWPPNWIPDAPPCTPVARFAFAPFREAYAALLQHPELHHSRGTLLSLNAITATWCQSPIGVMLIHSDLGLIAEDLENRYLMPRDLHWATPRQLCWVIGVESLWSRYVYAAQHPMLYAPYEIQARQAQVATLIDRAPNFSVQGQDYMLELQRNIIF